MTGKQIGTLQEVVAIDDDDEQPGNFKARKKDLDSKEGRGELEKGAKTKEGGGELAKGAKTKFKVLTYNVWFEEEVEVKARMGAIGAIIVAEVPDFVMLQEVRLQASERSQAARSFHSVALCCSLLGCFRTCQIQEFVASMEITRSGRRN